MIDYGTRQTDLAVKRAEWRLSRVYRQASRDIEDKLKDWEKRHAAREAKYRQQVKDGKLSQADFDAWMRGQVFQEKQWQARKAEIDNILLNADKAAANIINDGKLGVFANNANYIGYELEHGESINTGFTLYDQNTVARLIKSDPQILPKAREGVQKDKAFSYYNKLMNSAITQGIIQGESIPEIAKRIANKTGESSYKSAVRNARTAYTGAQNAGRIEGLHQAQRLGINVKKKWMATLDSRTRDAHAALDGQVQEVDDPFESELGKIMYPGDPMAAAGNVYNCRCTLVYVYPEYHYEMQRRDNETGEIIGDMTYRDWAKMKRQDEETSTVVAEPDRKGIRFTPATDYSETPQQTKYRNLESLGYSEPEIKELEGILERHTTGNEVQAKADAEIMEHLERNDKIGKLIRDKAELESQAWDLEIQKAKKQALEDYQRKVEDAKEYLKPGGIYSNYTEEDLKDWGVWPEEPNIKEPRFYRKGSMDRDVLSFSKSDRGAGMSFLTDEEDGYIGYDVSYTLSELEKMGYRPIAGVISMDVGMSGEAEVLFVKLPKKRKR